MTFWEGLADGEKYASTREMGELLRRLHGLEPPQFSLPDLLPETASRYYLSLPATAQRILREAAGREDGYVPAEVLRGPNGEGKLTGSSGAFKAALKRGVRRNWWIADQVSPVLAEGPGFGKVAGYRIRTEALPAFQAAVTTHQQGELASQKDCLADVITTGDGDWDAQRAVTALHEIGHAVDEKRARQILRDLAAEGLLQRIDAGRALYRIATDPEK